MSQFVPKIFSLSTLGIRQHFNCDYRFHTLRTDFSGESGSGKSMVADMIQLLLVGSAEFKSGTDGNQVRDTKGMVLASKGSRYGRAYILLNIEILPRKYVALGGYLETASNTLQSFIIQDGYDWEETLKPMDSPIFYKDLLCDGQVETVEELAKKHTKGYLKVLSLKKYHLLLYKNGILSIDLSASKQNLKSYATILRAFSRGKGFNTDSESLKTFLFGEEDRLMVMEKYKEEVRNISADFQQHQLYQDEIKLIHHKQKSIEEVAAQFQTYQRLQKEFVTNKAIFWHDQHSKLTVLLQTSREDYVKFSVCQNLISRKWLKMERDDIDRQFRELEKSQALLTTARHNKENMAAGLSIAKEALKRPVAQKLIVDEVQSWIAAQGGDIEQVTQWFKAARQKAKNQETRQRFEDYLDQYGIRQDFELSYWHNNPESAAMEHEIMVMELKEQIRQKEIFTVFADLENPASLAAWSVKELIFPLSLEQESLLVHFQNMERQEPAVTKGERYLPFPEKLLKAPVIAKSYAHGFWVELAGVYEFIDHVTIRYLDTPSTESLANQFRDNQKNAVSEMKKLKLLLTKLETLAKHLTNFSGLAEAIVLYKDSSLVNDIHDPVSEITETDFARRVEIYRDKDLILETYASRNQEMEDVYRRSLTADNNYEQHEQNIKRISQELSLRYGEISPESAIHDREQKIDLLEQHLDALLELHEKPAGYALKLENNLFAQAITLADLIRFKSETDRDFILAEQSFKATGNQLDLCVVNLENAQTQYFLMFGQLYERSDANTVRIENPEEGNDNIKDRCEKAYTRFTTLYDNAGAGLEDQTVLADYSVGLLAHKLLPTVFQTSEVDEQLIGQQIAQRLQDLTNDMQKIGARKLEILNKVFSEVHQVYNRYLDKVHQIHNYLKNNEHTITGGNHASLQSMKSVDYPESWMTTFRKRLSEQLNNQGLFEKLYQEMDVNKLMIDVFRECGGSPKVTYEDLLNPKSYFDLKFEIKQDSGQNNAGSNGQTYTANALLCLARLSLIQEEKRSGLKFIPIDEAEGLGGNYDMLHELAQKEKFQLITMSIETAGDIEDGQQYIYIMHDNRSANEESYVPPLGIFTDGKLTDDISAILTDSI